MQAIFKEMYLLCRVGEDFELASQVWHSLKCYKFQQDMFTMGFSKHKVVQKMLFQHLKMDVVLKSVYDKDVAALTKKIDLSKSHQSYQQKLVNK